MSEQFITKRDEVKSLLRRLFRSEEADLDFGIQRIMNFKRREIEQFIDRDLIEMAEAEFKQYAMVGTAELGRELERLKEEINSNFGTRTIDPEGRVTRNHDAPKVQRYIRTQEEYRTATLTEEQVNDVFNHVYEFFSRYYDDGDFITRPKDSWKAKYSIPYKGEEVTLHWATKNMYYVKTGEFFKKYSFKTGIYRINFVLVNAQVETGNAKSEKKFFILSDEEPVQIYEIDREVEIKFKYRKLTDAEKAKYGTRNIQVKIVSETLEKMNPLLEQSSIVGILRPRGDEDKSLMEKHLNSYVDRNTKDFFIHKNLKGFLERELNFYLKNEVWSLEELESSNERVSILLAAKAKTIRGISQKIIEFLSQIEEFQKKLFEKKKFVLRTDYCMTLDIVPEELYEAIGMNEKQVEEWKELYKLDEITNGNFYSTNGKTTLTVDFLKQYKYLSLDTKFFSPEFKDKLLERFENIDDSVKGLIIKSENLQALKLISKKYNENIKCGYIDPPYNTGSDDFLYKDNYQHSSWLSMMNDRLALARGLMGKDGVLFIHIDENEQFRLRMLLENIFGPENYIAPLIWPSRAGKGGTVAKIQIGHDYIECISKEKQYTSFKPIVKEIKTGNYEDEKGEYRRELLRQWGSQAHRREDRPSMYFPIPTPYGVDVYPILPNGSDGRWRFGKEKVMQMLNESDLDFARDEKTGNIIVYRKMRVGRKTISVPSNILDDVGSSADGTKEIIALFGEKLFDTCKPLKLAERLVELITWQDTSPVIILDFFAGSGTAGHSVIQLNDKDDGNRKYILVEIDDHSYSILKSRIQKVVYSKDWEKGLPQSRNGYSHIFKHQYLEQYEDTLNNIEFISPDGTIQKTLERFPDYFISYMLDYETRDSPTRLSIEQFKTPFNYKIKTLSGGEEREEPIDLVETFNYLLGIHIKRIRTHKDGDRVYRAVFGERDREQVAVIWRGTSGLDLRKDKRFIEEKILADSTFDTIYVNGDSYIQGAKPIEPEFRRLMSA